MTTLHAPLSHPKYRPDIDGLRAVAVLSVIGFHAFPDFVVGGFVGVDIFFVISGYLISTIIFENLNSGTFSFAEFYSRRIKRIFPSLFLVMIVSFGLGFIILGEDDFKRLGKHIAAGAGFISNIVLWNESGYFDTSAETKPLLHLWSLGIEEQFYIVWPPLLLLAWKNKVNLFGVTLVLAIISFSLNINGINVDASAMFYSPQTRFWELLCGSSLAWLTLYKHREFSLIANRLNSKLSKFVYSSQETLLDSSTLLRNGVSVIGFLVLIFGFSQIDKTSSFPGKWAVVPVFGAMLILSAGQTAFVNRKILSNRLFVWVGLISYPLYLWHWPLLSFARIIENGVPSLFLRLLLVVSAVVLAWLTYKFVERPIRLGKHGNAKTLILVVLMFLVGYSGYAVSKKVEIDPNILDQGKSCEDFHSVEGSASCKVYGNGKTLVVVWGDSHALTLQKTVPKSFLNQNFKLMVVGHHGCPPVVGVVRADKKGNAGNCLSTSTLSSHATYIASKNPSKVVLVGRWTLYLRGFQKENKLQDASHFLALETNQLPSEEVSRRAFAEGMARTISLFKNTDLFVLGQAPDLQHLGMRRIEMLAETDRAPIDRWHSVELDTFNALPIKAFTYINTRDYFCNTLHCSLKLSKQEIYSDDNHLSGLGLLRIWDILNANLFPLTTPSRQP